MAKWGVDGWSVTPGKGRHVDLGPDVSLEVLLRGADCDGAMGVFVFEHPVIPENPAHAHGGFMKVLYVLDGVYQFRIGAAEFEGGPGSLVVVPRGSYHAFTTATGGRVLFACSPSGNEELFLELAALDAQSLGDAPAEILRRFETADLPGPPWRPAARSDTV